MRENFLLQEVLDAWAALKLTDAEALRRILLVSDSERQRHHEATVAINNAVSAVLKSMAMREEQEATKA